MIRQGDIYDAQVMVIKVRRGVPTVIAVGGKVYVYQPADQYQGGAKRPEGSGHHGGHMD